jgi:hypothetical protein
MKKLHFVETERWKNRTWLKKRERDAPFDRAKLSSVDPA